MLNYNIYDEISLLINYCLKKDLLNSINKVNFFLEKNYDVIDIISLLIENVKNVKSKSIINNNTSIMNE
jgi:hypothetical protein